MEKHYHLLVRCLFCRSVQKTTNKNFQRRTIFQQFYVETILCRPTLMKRRLTEVQRRLNCSADMRTQSKENFKQQTNIIRKATGRKRSRNEKLKDNWPDVGLHDRQVDVRKTKASLHRSIDDSKKVAINGCFSVEFSCNNFTVCNQ